MKYIDESFDANWIAPPVPNVNALFEYLIQYRGTKHAAFLGSGTAAIHLALILLGFKSDNRVIAYSFTLSATINPIVYCTATPVLVDSEPDTWNLDPQLLEQASKDKKQKTKVSR